MNTARKRFALLTGMLTDRVALYGVATKITQGVAGLVSVVFIVRHFSPAVQGYYYTFSNLLALQIFLELGLSTVVTIFAAHEWSKLRIDSDGTVRGDEAALSRLRSLTRKIAVWYLCGGAALLTLLAPAGLWFLGSQPGEDLVNWRLPWVTLCVISTLSFLATPIWAVLTGCGQLVRINPFRMIETAARYAVLWTCMALGASLWSAVGAAAVSAIATSAFFVLKYLRFLRSIFARPSLASVDWLKELAPLQMRIAISWISGYFAFSIFTPVMFHFHGAAEAGKVGMTWALVAGISGIAGTWLQVQAPQFSMMVSSKEYAKLDAAARRTALIGVAIQSAGALTAVGLVQLLSIKRPDLAARLVPLGPLALFLFAELLHQVSMVQSTYLRAFKKEPFLGISVASGIVIGLGTFLLTPAFGAYGPAVSYLSGVGLALIWGTIVFVRHRASWTTSSTH